MIIQAVLMVYFLFLAAMQRYVRSWLFYWLGVACLVLAELMSARWVWHNLRGLAEWLSIAAFIFGILTCVSTNASTRAEQLLRNTLSAKRTRDDSDVSPPPQSPSA